MAAAAGDVKTPAPEPPAPAQPQAGGNTSTKNYKGFVAGVFSGIAKLSGTFIPSPQFDH